MLKRAPIVWWLSCALVLSGCANGGKAVKPACPQLAPVPPSLMVEPQTETKVRAELFEPPLSATPRSEGSKP